MNAIIGLISALLGAAAMWGVYPHVWPAQVPDGFYDLSMMPDELQAQYADPAGVQVVIRDSELKSKMIADLRAERAARDRKTLPDGVPEFPYEINLYEARSDANWPALDAEVVQAAIDEAKDQWVIINYWASWCSPCLMELPDMNAAAERLADHGVKLMTLNADPMGRDTQSDVDKIFEARELDRLPRLIAVGSDVDKALSSAAMARSGVAYPHSLIFAPGGVPYAYFEGLPILPDHAPVWNSDEMISFFEALSATDRADAL